MRNEQIAGVLGIIFGILFAILNPIDTANLASLTAALGIFGWVLFAIGIILVLKYI